MSENPGTTTDSTTSAPLTSDSGDTRLYRVLAWVGIVTGVVVTVAVIFFAGMAVGRSAGAPGWHRYHQGQMGPSSGMDSCPMMRGGSMMGPDGMGPGMAKPDQPPVAPSPVPPAR